MVSALKSYRVRKKEEPYIGLIHRLDQPVEGVMVFAKTKAAAANLSAQVRDRLVEKQYLAVLDGIPCEKSGELKDYLLRDGGTNTSRVVPRETPGAKSASLSYEILKTDNMRNCALARITLHTGRHHQIRVQFAHAGYPIYADTKYGKSPQEGGYCPVALCSCRIGFVHPVTKQEMFFEIQPKGKGFLLLGT